MIGKIERLSFCFSINTVYYGEYRLVQRIDNLKMMARDFHGCSELFDGVHADQSFEKLG
jgi:hypothetical protein